MEWHSLEDCSPKWTRLLTTLSLPRGVELAEKLLQKTDISDNKDVFHWPCFLKQLTSHTIITTKDHDIIERTHYASLPYTVRLNLLMLLLRQHVVVGHRELERFVNKLKDEAGISLSHNWEGILLGRLQELVEPMPVNLEPIATVHLSGEVIESITNDWLNKTGTSGIATGSVVSWMSLKEVGSHKRLPDLLSMHEPPPKKTKIGSDEERVTSPALVEGETDNSEDINDNLQHVSKSSVTGTEVNPRTDFSPIIVKLKCLCNGTIPFDDKQAIILWEELASVDIDQLKSCLKLMLTNEFKEQGVIIMLYFIASMPVTIGSQIAGCLSTVTVLPHLCSMDQPASRTFVAAFSYVARKQPTVCIQDIITPLFQQKQFGSTHSDLICTLIRGGDFGDHASSLWRVLVAVDSRDCWNDHIVLLAQALLDAKVELDKVLISETLQALLHVAGYMTGNLRFGKLLLTMVSRHQGSMLEHLGDLEQLAAMITPAFMQRSLQLAIKKLQ